MPIITDDLLEILLQSLKEEEDNAGEIAAQCFDGECRARWAWKQAKTVERTLQARNNIYLLLLPSIKLGCERYFISFAHCRRSFQHYMEDALFL